MKGNVFGMLQGGSNTKRPGENGKKEKPYCRISVTSVFYATPYCMLNSVLMFTTHVLFSCFVYSYI